MPILAGAAISGATQLIGGFLSSRAAKKAAEKQAIAGEGVAKSLDAATGAAQDRGYQGIEQANNAVDTGLESSKNYIANAGDTQKNLYGDMTVGLQPYRDAGAHGLDATTYALDKMKAGAGTFAFDPKDMENEPGYKFQLQQGMKQLQNSAAARGMLTSGSTLKALTGYNQGLAGTSYQNAYNRALSTFNTNQQGYQTLASLGTNLAGFGQNANSQAIQAAGIYGGQTTSLANMGSGAAMQGAGLKSNVAMQGNEYIGDVGLRGAGMAGDARLGVGNANAAGVVGSANAWNGALGGVANAANTYSMAKAMDGDGGGPPPAQTNWTPPSPWTPVAPGSNNVQHTS